MRLNASSGVEPFSFSPRVRMILAALAAFGMVFLNGPFLYVVLFRPDLVRAALVDPVAQVLMAEAFLVLGLLAWLVHRLGFRSPGWKSFVLLSIVGGLAFGLPAFLCWAGCERRGGSRRP